MLMSEGDIDNFLVGGFDELTEYSHKVMARLNILRKEPCSNLELYSTNESGIITGEGSAFFVLSKQQNASSYGKLIDNEVFFEPEHLEDLKKKMIAFLDKNNLSVRQLDVVIAGLCGDADLDKPVMELNETLFPTQTVTAYKHLCGEYATSSSFAFWLAAKMLKTGHIPETTMLTNRKRKPENILIVNLYKNQYSLILFRKC